MLNITELTAFFIEVNYTPQTKRSLLDGFSLLEGFGLIHYEDKYVDVITNDNTIDNNIKTSLVVEYLRNDLCSVIKQHGISLDEDHSLTLVEALEICHLLLLLPNLEDYSEVGYLVHSDRDYKSILVSLLERYTELPVLRAMECIGGVSETLIEALRELSRVQSDTDEEQLSLQHKKYVDEFFLFTENAPCLGLTLHNQGYSGRLTLEDLLAVVPFDVSQVVDKSTDSTQVALDILSLLTITKDDYDKPLMKFKRYSDLFTSDSRLVTRIGSVILAIMSDFGTHLEVCAQREKVND